MEQIIYGQVPAKSNKNRIVVINGKRAIIPSRDVKEYEQSFILQCKYRNRNIEGTFRIDIDVYFRSNRSDIDNAMKAILDNLEKCHAISNDRNCAIVYARKFVDKKNPRIEFTLTEISSNNQNT